MSLTLATLGSIIAYLTNLIIIIPLVFGLGIPLVNIDKPLRQKIGFTLVITFISFIVFILTVITAISFNFDKYVFPGLLVGIAGILILGINGLLIETIKLNLKTIALTFVLSGLSLPVWIILTENVLPTTMTKIELVRQFGVMLFWMTMTTIGICFAIKKNKLTL
ncbi:hypothetical protein [Mucilaginibacter sp.]|uniref:hypothetical protein n=1 Tax=Mucilaginibacter sp. TaxID=1882438 RepID=UPI003B009644